MTTLLNALHVLLTVFMIGPLVVAPLLARRAIARRDARAVRQAANQVAFFGAGSVLVAALGVATVVSGDRWTMTTPWVLISSTLYVVALGLIVGYAVPALRRAATIIGEVGPTAEATAAATAGTLGARHAGATTAGGAARDATAGGDTAGGGTAGDGAAGDGAAGRDRGPSPGPDRARLDTIAARVTGTGWLLVLTFAVITVLMTVRPFD